MDNNYDHYISSLVLGVLFAALVAFMLVQHADRPESQPVAASRNSDDFTGAALNQFTGQVGNDTGGIGQLPF